MKTILILLAVITLTFASKDWELFKTKYQKYYNNEEEETFRKQVFFEKLKLVEEHNKKYKEGLSSYQIQINKFADLTKNEMFATSQSSVRNASTTGQKITISGDEEIPDSIDWRDYGVISPIADQLMCNSCWAFAAVATVEAHWAIYQSENVSLSQQNLAECVDPNFTCPSPMRSDILDMTYQYIIDNGGIDTKESYPNIYYSLEACHFDPSNIGASIQDYGNVSEGDEEELRRVVGTIGPVTVAITTDTNWSLYSGGIYYKEDCMDVEEIFNHAVVIVGYGSEDGLDYWLVRNSWGVWFGDGGYIKMARNKENNCGIASIARYPLI